MILVVINRSSLQRQVFIKATYSRKSMPVGKKKFIMCSKFTFLSYRQRVVVGKWVVVGLKFYSMYVSFTAGFDKVILLSLLPVCFY